MTKKITKLMLNGQEYEIREYQQGGWQPGANTIAYLPLKGNLNDLAGNYTWQGTTNLSYVNNVANITVARINSNDGYAYTTTNGPQISGSGSYTMSGWVKLVSATSGMCILDTGINMSPESRNGMSYYKFYESSTYKGYFVMYLGGYSGTSGFEFGYNNNIGTDWHLWTVTYTPGSAKIYLDGNVVSTASYSLSGTVTPGYSMEIGRLGHRDRGSMDAYYSDIIFEDKERTAQEISDYYDQTKDQYQSSEPQTEPCHVCGGTGEEECIMCSGAGQEMCPTCLGTGQIGDPEDPESRTTCPDCDGEGFIICGNCGGTGMVTCSNCGGTGEEPGE